MPNCPENPTPQTCGFEAARILVEDKHIVLEPYDKAAPIKIDLSARSVMEALNPLRIEGSGIYDIADFGCVACGQCIQVIDDDGSMHFELKDNA